LKKKKKKKKKKESEIDVYFSATRRNKGISRGKNGDSTWRINIV
jgi:hypothetical protein